MLKLARFPRPLAALALLAGLVSTAPPVRWCALPWSEVSVEDFAACEAAPGDCAQRCASECDARSCASERADAPAPARDRAFCLESPAVATQGPGSVALDPPAALAAIGPDAAELPEPAGGASRPGAFEPARPRARPPGLPPPVRGPPCVA